MNADYGARFLEQLFERAGSWPKAVELYHSATPELGLDYQRKVYAALPEEQRLASAMPLPLLPHGWGAMFASPTLPSGGRQQTARIILQTPGLGGAMAPGRTLEMYRSMPVRMVWSGR
jgi:hypothetical protein